MICLETKKDIVLNVERTHHPHGESFRHLRILDSNGKIYSRAFGLSAFVAGYWEKV